MGLLSFVRGDIMPLGPMRTKSQKRAGAEQVMHEYKVGALHSGSKTGPVVKNRKQAIAIMLKQTGQSRKRRSGGRIGEMRHGGTVASNRLDRRARGGCK